MDTVETKTANRLATGAPGSVVIGDRTYLVAQPTKADFVTLGKELRRIKQSGDAKVIAEVAKEVKDLPPAIQKMAIDAAVKMSKSDPDPNDLQSVLFEPEAVAFWAWLLIRKGDPTVSLASLKAAIGPDNVDEICARLIEANGLKEASPN